MTKATWSKWGLRSAAAVLACLLWLYAVTEHTYTTEVDVRLEVADPPAAGAGPRGLVVADPPPSHVRIAVAGRGKDLLQLTEDSFVLRLEPHAETRTTRTYRLTQDMIVQRDEELQVTVLDVVQPRELQVTLDWRLRRRVPVEPAVDLTPADRYVQVGGVQVEPDSVELAGPASRISGISRIATDSLMLVDVQEDVDQALALRLPNGTRCTVEPTQVRVSASVQILAQDDLLRVPVAVRNLEGVQADPSRVRVRVKGGIDIIANLDPERDVSLYVDGSAYGGEPLPIQFEPSPYFEIVEIAPPSVHVSPR